MPRFFSPAKVNLLLAILQIDDGFHQLSSIVVANFETISSSSLVQAHRIALLAQTINSLRRK